MRRVGDLRCGAQAEGLTLLKAENKAGYFGVYFNKPGEPKSYQGRVWRGGKDVYLSYFATAEEARRCVSRGRRRGGRQQRERCRWCRN